MQNKGFSFVEVTVSMVVIYIMALVIAGSVVSDNVDEGCRLIVNQDTMFYNGDFR